jgi:predicted peptidase
MSHLRECNGTHRRSSGAAILLLLGLLAWTLPSLLPTVAVGADPNEFLVFNYVRESDGAVGMPGRLFVPPGYNPGQAYPLVVFYHGWGERGTNNTSQVNSNINNLLANAKTRNFFIYAPQAGDPGWNLTAVEASMRMVGWALRQYRIDPTRIYTTGVSNGGNATYNAMSNYADVLAAGVPICGNGADALKDAQLARRPLSGSTTPGTTARFRWASRAPG